MDTAKFGEIRAMYEKHGWVLRRILAASESSPLLVTADVPASAAGIDAAWFSRPPQPGEVAWEIRYLGEPPFALVQSFDEAAPDFEDSLRDLEWKLREAVTGKA